MAFLSWAVFGLATGKMIGTIALAVMAMGLFAAFIMLFLDKR